MPQIAREHLRFAVAAHDPLVAADAPFVFGRHAARRVERLLAREHHRPARRHDEHPARVHEHGRFRVEVALRADVHTVDDDVDGPALARELDNPAQDAHGPVEVLGRNRRMIPTRCRSPSR